MPPLRDVKEEYGSHGRRQQVKLQCKEKEDEIGEMEVDTMTMQIQSMIGPYQHGRIEAKPKDAAVVRADGLHVFERFKHPLVRAVFFHVDPPPQAHQQPARHVFHGPKVKCKQQNHYYGNENIVGREKAAEQVNKQRERLEEQVEDLEEAKSRGVPARRRG